MRSVKRVFRTVLVLAAFCSLYAVEGRTKDAKVGWRDEWNRFVDERIDAKMTTQFDSKIQTVDERYRIRERDVVGLCEKEIDFLTNKVNFLGILLTFAGIVAVAVPIYAGLKIRASFENSRAAIARAKEAIAKVESTRAEGLKSRAQWNFVNSKDSHQHHFEERAVFAGCGVRAVGTNESNTYRRTQRKNTVFRSANQYSRPQPITLKHPINGIICSI